MSGVSLMIFLNINVCHTLTIVHNTLMFVVSKMVDLSIMFLSLILRFLFVASVMIVLSFHFLCHETIILSQ